MLIPPALFPIRELYQLHNIVVNDNDYYLETYLTIPPTQLLQEGLS